MDVAFWEKVRRYRRIVAVANEEEAARQAKRSVRLDHEEVRSDKRQGSADKAAAD